MPERAATASRPGRRVLGLVAVFGAMVIGSPAAAQVVGCTTATPASLLASGDPVLEAALHQAFDDTWDDAEAVLDSEGTPLAPGAGTSYVKWPDAKENGGWIYRCWDSAGSEFTKVVTWPEGNYWKVEEGPKLDAGNCALVGRFHTHTGSKSGHPDNDGTPNEHPSGADMVNANDDGIPGLIVYGHPNDPSSYGVTPYGPATPADACPPDSGDGAESAGEPHLLTFDGHRYEFQAVGEFVLVRSLDDDLQVQARQAPTAVRQVTMNTAVVVRIDGSTVEVDETAVVVDGEATPRTRFDAHRTPGGGEVRNDGGVIRFTWADGSRASFVGASVVVDLADARAGRLEGLLGDDDGRPADDLVGDDGESLLDDGRLTFAETYRALAPAWRVTADDSLFTYPPGKGPEDYADDAPAYPLLVDMVAPGSRTRAEAACARRGIADGRRLQQCAFDVAVTGSESWADEAAALARERERLAAPDGTALVEATGLQQVDEVRRLLAAGAPPDGRDADGRTALLAAVPTGNPALVTTLLDAGADPGLAGGDGATPLHLAAFWGFDEMADALLAAGADTETRDGLGRTPAAVAAAQGHPELAERLS